MNVVIRALLRGKVYSRASKSRRVLSQAGVFLGLAQNLENGAAVIGGKMPVARVWVRRRQHLPEPPVDCLTRRRRQVVELFAVDQITARVSEQSGLQVEVTK